MANKLKPYPNGYFQWEVGAEGGGRSGRRNTIAVRRMNKDTLTLTVTTTIGETMFGYDLTPDQAREMAEVLIEGAQIVEDYNNENPA